MHLFKLKKGKEQLLLEWGARLMGEFRTEALISLSEENVTREIVYMFHIGDDCYAIGHMEGENMRPANTDRSLNIRHKEVLRECIDSKIELNRVYEISTHRATNE